MAVRVRLIGKDRATRVVVLDVSGTVTIGKGDVELRDRFKALLQEGERRFLFNLTNVGHMDSAGVGETVACHKRATERGATIKIVLTPRGKPDELFKITMLDRVFEIFHDENEALTSFGS